MHQRLSALAAALVLSLVAPVPGASAAGPRVTAGHSAWVSVSVARLWQTPTSPRRVDAPALAAPVRFRQWLGAMSLRQRRALFQHSDTEALMGERVVVRRVSGGWARVVVPDQPTPRDSGGYPGWVPLRQLTATAPARTLDVVTVVRRTAWLLGDDTASARTTEISSGTTLPVVGHAGDLWRVRTPQGTLARIAASDVVAHRSGTPAPVRGDVVDTAESYRGVAYLWGGLSGFGLDCSGLTWLSFRQHGVQIFRDASPQSQHGTRVARANLRRGDLIFYATRGLVHHVTMYAGHGTMVESPHTGAVVRVVPVRSTEYDGARRY